MVNSSQFDCSGGDWANLHGGQKEEKIVGEMRYSMIEGGHSGSFYKKYVSFYDIFLKKYAEMRQKKCKFH